MSHHLTLAPEVARRFADVLREWLTDEEWLAMRAANKTVPPGTCASHDYCDSNMAMDRALREALALQVPEEGTDFDALPQDEVTPLWNAAWEIATPRYLTEGACEEEQEVRS